MHQDILPGSRGTQQINQTSRWFELSFRQEWVVGNEERMVLGVHIKSFSFSKCFVLINSWYYIFLYILKESLYHRWVQAKIITAGVGRVGREYLQEWMELVKSICRSGQSWSRMSTEAWGGGKGCLSQWWSMDKHGHMLMPIHGWEPKEAKLA